MDFIITCTTPISEAVVRVEATSVTGGFLVVDIVTRFFPGIAIGNTMRLDIGVHNQLYAVNAQVVAVSEGCMLASYGGFVIRVEGGLSAAQIPTCGSLLKASLSCVSPSEYNHKRARCA
jgi:hypothetical protein